MIPPSRGKLVDIKEGTILRYPIKDANGSVLAGAGTEVTRRLLELLERRRLHLELIATLEVAEGNQAGLEIPVKGRPMTVGRDVQCNIRPTSELVSKHHCTVWKQGLGLFVKDNGSTNGTFINGLRVDGERELNDGDVVGVGNMKLKAHLFAAVKGDARFAKAAEETILTEKGGSVAPDPAGTTKPGFDASDVAEFRRMLEDDKKKSL